MWGCSAKSKITNRRKCLKLDLTVLNVGAQHELEIVLKWPLSQYINADKAPAEEGWPRISRNQSNKLSQCQYQCCCPKTAARAEKRNSCFHYERHRNRADYRVQEWASYCKIGGDNKQDIISTIIIEGDTPTLPLYCLAKTARHTKGKNVFHR